LTCRSLSVSLVASVSTRSILRSPSCQRAPGRPFHPLGARAKHPREHQHSDTRDRVKSVALDPPGLRSWSSERHTSGEVVEPIENLLRESQIPHPVELVVG